jgi:hypothetical protein
MNTYTGTTTAPRRGPKEGTILPNHDLPYLQQFPDTVTEFDIVSADGVVLLGPISPAIASRQMGNIRDVRVRQHEGAL